MPIQCAIAPSVTTLFCRAALSKGAVSRRSFCLRVSPDRLGTPVGLPLRRFDIEVSLVAHQPAIDFCNATLAIVAQSWIARNCQKSLDPNYNLVKPSPVFAILRWHSVADTAIFQIERLCESLPEVPEATGYSRSQETARVQLRIAPRRRSFRYWETGLKGEMCWTFLEGRVRWASRH